jgi:hypothetical protein
MVRVVSNRPNLNLRKTECKTWSMQNAPPYRPVKADDQTKLSSRIVLSREPAAVAGGNSEEPAL